VISYSKSVVIKCSMHEESYWPNPSPKWRAFIVRRRIAWSLSLLIIRLSIYIEKKFIVSMSPIYILCKLIWFWSYTFWWFSKLAKRCDITYMKRYHWILRDDFKDILFTSTRYTKKKKKIPQVMVSKFKLKQSREYKFLNNKLTLEIEIVLILSENIK